MFRRRKVQVFINSLFAFILIVTNSGPALQALADSLPPDPPAPEAETAGGTIYLPAVLSNVSAMDDGQLISWAQAEEGGQRFVYLAWQVKNEIAPGVIQFNQAAVMNYTVARRPVGGTTWTPIGVTRPAANPAVMEAILGPNLTTQLQHFLREKTSDPPLTSQELYALLLSDDTRVQFLGKRYFAVGKVRGTAFKDNPTVLNDFEYTVLPYGDLDQAFPKVTVLDEGTKLVPANLQEVWTGPAQLGVPGSALPNNQEYRYHWDRYQKYRPWDGSVYLEWDVEIDDTSNLNPAAVPPPPDSTPDIVGYLVYRRVPGGSWQLANQMQESCQSNDPVDCAILAGEGAPSNHPDFPAYDFKDNLKDAFTDPADIYRDYDYKVCSLDLAGGERCSSPLNVQVRELRPPAAVSDIDTLWTEGNPLQITFIFSDTFETSTPLRFFVTRSPTLTLAAENWEPVGAYLESSDPSPITKVVFDTPPEDVMYWYRVQVRDDRGNWSPLGAVVSGAIFDRTAPGAPVVPGGTCADNRLPLDLNNLDPDTVFVNLYRSFTGNADDYQFIKRFPVTNGSAQITDDYTPPFGHVVYYKLEAVDAHWNASAPVDYCAYAESAGPPEMPIDIGLLDGSTPDEPGIDIPYDHEVEIVIERPGPDGSDTVTETLTTDNFTTTVNEGEWVFINLRGANDQGTGPATSAAFYNSNDYLDTDRQMSDLGDLEEITWDLTTPSAPFVVINITGPCDPCGTPPLVAAFRRANPEGNWMQVTPVQEIEPQGDPGDPWLIYDKSDLNIHQEYTYVVLAFSPSSYEVLGFWGGNKLAANPSAPASYPLNTLISDPAPWNFKCTVVSQLTPKAAGLPEHIGLTDGWTLTVTSYRTSTGGACPPGTVDSDHLYGTGTIPNPFRPTQTIDVSFNDIGIDTLRDRLNAGRFIAEISGRKSGADRFTADFDKLEFTATDTYADLTLTLPWHIKFGTAQDDRSNVLLGRFRNIGTDLSFDPLTLNLTGQGTYIVDANLPWLLNFTAVTIGADEISFDTNGVAAQDRLNYTPVPMLTPQMPDNNLGFMRYNYYANSATIVPDGLQGTFKTSDAIAYSTSLPGAVVIEGDEGSIYIEDSAIHSGSIKPDTDGNPDARSTASLDYMTHPGSISYMPENGECPGGSGNTYLVTLCEMLFSRSTTQNLQLIPEEYGEGDLRLFRIGAQGVVSATGTLNREVAWSKFDVNSLAATLLVAAAAFEDSATSWAPMPAENAWKQYPAAVSGMDLDPGINLNAEGASVDYSYYPNDPEIPDVSYDLYVRHGGVSEHLQKEPDTAIPPRDNQDGYLESLKDLECTYLDNLCLTLFYRADLTLPYPSDVVFPLVSGGEAEDEWFIQDHDPIACVPTRGAVESPTTALHKYWRFKQTPSTFAYNEDLDAYNGALDGTGISRVFGLHGTAGINGLAQDNSDGVTLSSWTEWLPDGDTGNVVVDTDGTDYRVSGFNFTLEDVKLSRFYSTIGDKNSLPSLAGVDLRNNLAMPSEELLDGNKQLTSASLKACANTVTDGIGCGFVLLDGNAETEFFGRLEPQSTSQVAGPNDIDSYLGSSPVAVNDVLDYSHQLLAKAVKTPFVWTMANPIIDTAIAFLDIPLVFLGNVYGGALAMVLPDQSVLPSPMPEILSSDLGIVVTVEWDPSARSFDDYFYILIGYTASQGAFRELALNRHDPATGDIQPYDRWEDIETDIERWAQRFDYTLGGGAKDDPVDLAEEIWETGWCGTWDTVNDECADANPKRAKHGQTFLEPYVRSLGYDEYEYGLHSLTSGEILESVHVDIYAGYGQISMMHNGFQDWRMDELKFGMKLSSRKDTALLTADWLYFETNRDGELKIYGDNVSSNALISPGQDLSIDFTLEIVNTGPGWELLEGGVTIHHLAFGDLHGTHLTGVYGSGIADTGDAVWYAGGSIDMTLGNDIISGLGFGVQLIFGEIPSQSTVLERHGFEDLLAKLKSDLGTTVVSGFYFAGYGDFPIYDGTCMFSANAEVEIRVWYFAPVGGGDPGGGGTLMGGVYAEGLCLISARGNLSLTVEHVLAGFPASVPTSSITIRFCHDEGNCWAFSGDFWVAIGIGWCEPGNWDTFDEVFDDSWCWTAGIQAYLAYLDYPRDGGDTWVYDIVPRVE